jgi:hypothetical protein
VHPPLLGRVQALDISPISPSHFAAQNLSSYLTCQCIRTRINSPPHAGGRGRREEKPKTKEDLDAEMDAYFSKDEKIFSKVR